MRQQIHIIIAASADFPSICALPPAETVCALTFHGSERLHGRWNAEKRIAATVPNQKYSTSPLPASAVCRFSPVNFECVRAARFTSFASRRLSQKCAEASIERFPRTVAVLHRPSLRLMGYPSNRCFFYQHKGQHFVFRVVANVNNCAVR